MSIKTNFEIPRGNDPDGLQIQGQRLAQDLSTNFKAIKKQIDSLSGGASSTVAPYQDFIATGWTTYIGTFLWIFTFNHTLGVVPSGFTVIDFVGNASNAYNEMYSVTRTAWTSSTITVKLTYTGYTGQPVINGSFTMRVF